jgi:hypothetical protein
MSFGLSAAAIGGIAAGVGAVGGAYISSQGAKSAANTQAGAANYAADLQNQQFQQYQQNLQPYMDLGQTGIQGLTQVLNSGNLNTPFSYGAFNFNPTEQQLQQTPGYQFTLQQGMKNTNNALAAKGLNLSGAQAKGLANYTTGLADQTYQQQYQNALNAYNTNYNNAFNTYNANYKMASDQAGRYQNLIGLGENAAAGVGNAGLQSANQQGNYLTQGANAQAAGTVGSANALSQGLGNLGSQGLLYSLMNNTNSNGNIYGSPDQGIVGWTPSGS